ncbi:MAG TPA: winged helix-turn-helix domain-containing protein [Xanthobacteraceae bacterium]|nr:winged helix-turn-helix domain-containing protein [Xanthobacteraceae bacterium]
MPVSRPASMTDVEQPNAFSFGRFRVLVRTRELLADGAPVALGSRAFEVLMVLMEARGALVTKDELMNRVWSNTIVEENTLQSQILALRKALGEDRGLVLTVTGRGYRFTGEIRVLDEGREATAEASGVDDLSGPSSKRKFTNLPTLLSPLIGRARELDELSALTASHRLMTLTGAGGIGKTRLAIETARRLLPQFIDGVWLIELAPLSDADLIGGAIVAAVGLRLSAGELSPARLAAAFGAKCTLLVFDNCEHIVDALSHFVEGLLHVAPTLRILATSREPLGVEGERVYQVPPLAIPPEHARGTTEVLDYSAVDLFCLRAKAADRNFSLDDDGASAVAAICRRLDGIPLAIEFAAAGTAALGLSALAAHLGQAFDLLSAGRRTSLARHRTLRATLDWSYNLLPESERLLLRRLSVFSGGFTLDAAGAVGGGDQADGTTIIGRVAALVTKSLIATQDDGHRRRYRLLETTRVYAFELLAESGEMEAVRRRHADYYGDLLQAAVQNETVTSDPFAAHAAEIDNIRAALTWAFSQEGDVSIGIALAASSSSLWLELSLLSECRNWMEKAIASLDAAHARGTRNEMLLQMGYGTALWSTGGTHDEVRQASSRALELAELLGGADYQLRALNSLWLVHRRGSDLRTALELANKSAAVAKDMTSLAGAITAERLIGNSLWLIGDQPSARRHLERAVERVPSGSRLADAARFMFDQRTSALSVLANVLWTQGLPDRAVRTARLGISEARTIDHPLSLCNALLMGGAMVCFRVGDLAATEEYVTTLITQADELSADVYRRYGVVMRGMVWVKRGSADSGLQQLRVGLDMLQKLHSWVFCTLFGADLAEAFAAAGAADEGRTVIDQALLEAEGGACWHMAELLRVKGELELMRSGEDAAAVEHTFLRSIDWARRQGALSWELRTATSLARLMQRQGRSDEAFGALAPVYSRFEEGFDTADLKSARALLHELRE